VFNSIRLTVLLLLFSLGLLSAQEYQNREILFCLKADRAPLRIEQSVRGIRTNYSSINQLLQRFGVIKVEKWLPMADARDVVDGVRLDHIYRVVFASPKDKENLRNVVKSFQAVSDVHSAALEAVNRVDATFEPYIPNDPYFSKQWYLNKIMAPQAWGLWGGEIPGDSTVLVGVVDTGIDYTHPDLVDAMWVNLGEDANGDGLITADDENGVDDDDNGYVDDFMGWDFANQDNDVMPPDAGPHQELSHGTHVAGIIAAVADNGVGIAGISFRSKLIVTKHAADNDLTDPSIVKGYSGILYCAKMGAKIINCSWGGGYDLYGKIVVDNVTQNYGAIVVTAAGNDSHNNDENHQYPSDYENTIAVAALNNTDEKAYYSNWGEIIDISAPGGEGASAYNAILSTIHVNAGSYTSWQGTSMASPVVAGAFALLKAWYPDDSRSELIHRLLSNADPIDAKNPSYKGLLGSGRVNVYNAIARDLFPKISLVQYAWQNTKEQTPHPGDSLRLEFTLENKSGWKDARDVKIHLRSTSPYVQILDSLLAIDSLVNGSIVDTNLALPTIHIAQDAPYQTIALQLVVTANDTSQYAYSTTFDLEVTPTMFLPGFPLQGYGFSTPLSVATRSNGEKAIVAVTSEGKLIAFDAKGRKLNGFPVDVGNTLSAPAIGDVDRDGKQEIVVVNRQGTVWVVRFNGLVVFQDALKESVYGQVALANMDGDPQLEMIFGSMKKNLHVLKLDSSEVAGFPKTMPSLINLGTALADFDGDNRPDMVFGTFNNQLHVVTATGDSLENFPIALSTRLSVAPIVVQNQDSINIIGVTLGHHLLKINRKGQIRVDVELGGELVGTPALADFDNDGQPEIVLATRDSLLNVLTMAGTPFNEHFPLKLTHLPQAGVLCPDINADGVPEILLVTDDGFLHAWKTDGNEVQNFPVDLENTSKALPVVDDLDNDGDADVVVGGSDQLAVLDLQAPFAEQVGWNTYLAGNLRIGNYGGTLTALRETSRTKLPQTIFLEQNYPNPFNLQTTIRCYLPAQVHGQNAVLKIYNVLGQEVRRFEWKARAGEFKLTWDGTNQAGQVVTSGIYFYRLSVNGQSRMRRMILLK